MIRGKHLLATVFLAGTVAALASTSAWKEFGTRDFFIIYPANWYRFEVTPDRLDLRSSKGGAEVVVIKDNQAYIFVGKERGSSAKTLAEVINYYNQEGKILSRRDISVRPGSKQGCSDLKEFVVKDPAQPPEDLPKGAQVPYFIHTEFFCEMEGQKFVTLFLTNWEGDKQQAHYQQVALRMAESIRSRK